MLEHVHLFSQRIKFALRIIAQSIPSIEICREQLNLGLPFFNFVALNALQLLQLTRVLCQSHIESDFELSDTSFELNLITRGVNRFERFSNLFASGFCFFVFEKLASLRQLTNSPCGGRLIVLSRLVRSLILCD